VVKDLYDVAGYPTGAGNPDWERTHPVPTETAPAVRRLLDAGATLVGKSCTEELAFSLDGINIHYGTPLNPRFPDRLPRRLVQWIGLRRRRGTRRLRPRHRHERLHPRPRELLRRVRLSPHPRRRAHRRCGAARAQQLLALAESLES